MKTSHTEDRIKSVTEAIIGSTTHGSRCFHEGGEFIHLETGTRYGWDSRLEDNIHLGHHVTCTECRNEWERVVDGPFSLVEP